MATHASYMVCVELQATPYGKQVRVLLRAVCPAANDGGWQPFDPKTSLAELLDVAVGPDRWADGLADGPVYPLMLQP